MKATAAALFLILEAMLVRCGCARYTTTTTTKRHPDMQDYTCNHILVGGKRPILTEREVIHFRRCVIAATVIHVNPEAVFDQITLTGQTWSKVNKGVRERRALGGVDGDEKNDGGGGGGGGKAKVSTRATCKKCETAIKLAPDSVRALRSLSAEGRRGALADDYESGLLECLKDETLYPGYPDNMNFDAFSGLYSVTGTCTVDKRPEPISSPDLIFDVTSRNEKSRRSKRIIETTCSTHIVDAQAPMLTEPEMAHFDHCWIESWNAYHSNDPLQHGFMIDNEIVEQIPSDGLMRRLSGGNRRLKKGFDGGGGGGQGGKDSGGSDLKNEVLTRGARCFCKPHDHLAFDRGRALREQMEDRRRTGDLTADDLLDFDQFLCECLKGGLEDVTLAAFAGNIQCETQCRRPIVNAPEFQEMQVAQRQEYERKKSQRQADFDMSAARDEQKIASNPTKAEENAILQAKREAFQNEQEDEEQRFESYQRYEAQAFYEDEAKTCARIMHMSNCGGVVVQNPFTVLNSHTGYIDLRLVQNFNMYLDGECSVKTTDKDGTSATSLGFLMKYNHWSINRPAVCRKVSALECGSFLDLQAQCTTSIPGETTFELFINKNDLLTTYEKSVMEDDAADEATSHYGGYSGPFGRESDHHLNWEGRPAWGEGTWGGEMYTGWEQTFGYNEESEDDKDRRRDLRELAGILGEPSSLCPDAATKAAAGVQYCHMKFVVECSCVDS